MQNKNQNTNAMQKNIIPNANDFDANRIYIFDDINVVSKFVNPSTNREMSQNHIAKLAKRDFEFFAPVQININNLHCFDGNHRIEAFKEKVAKGEKPTLKVIFYDIKAEDENRELRQCNSTQKKWMGKDYIGSLIKAGNPEIIKLNNFAKCHKITCDAKGNPKYTYAMQCVFGKRVDKETKNGTMPKINEGMLEYGAMIARECEAMMNKHCPNTSDRWVGDMLSVWHSKRKDKTFNEKLNKIGLGRFLNDFSLPAFLTVIGGKKQWSDKFDKAVDDALMEIKLMNSI